MPGLGRSSQIDSISVMSGCHISGYCTDFKNFLINNSSWLIPSGLLAQTLTLLRPDGIIGASASRSGIPLSLVSVSCTYE